ncbi:MAG: EFR1 family ferrodoxin [Synergistaceae bacterium]|nr:EFR1 family ferrodoxin [Synergistaceae bacterium]
MKSKNVTLAVFTGTGNTLLMAGVLADELKHAQLEVGIVSMDRPHGFKLPEDSALGLAVPLACFSTYPTAWRFIDSLPEGNGREAFFLATMGGMSGGMEGPIRRVVEGKGYKPIGAAIVKMPSNYANKTIPVEENRARIERAETQVKKFAALLRTGETNWGADGLASRFLARLAHGQKPWRMFHSLFPIAVDSDKCTGCGVCGELCPEKNILVSAGTAIIGKSCQSCQRCVGFCPARAISVPGKPAEQYRAMPLDRFKAMQGIE